MFCVSSVWALEMQLCSGVYMFNATSFRHAMSSLVHYLLVTHFTKMCNQFLVKFCEEMSFPYNSACMQDQFIVASTQAVAGRLVDTGTVQKLAVKTP